MTVVLEKSRQDVASRGWSWVALSLCLGSAGQRRRQGNQARWTPVWRWRFKRVEFARRAGVRSTHVS